LQLVAASELRYQVAMAGIDEVLAFWFEQPPQSEQELWQKIKRWFNGGPAMDDAIRERFGTDVDLALAGKLDDWAQTPRGLSALVLLLDQFTRGIYRDTRRAFAGDQQAQSLALRAFDSGMADELGWFEKQFLAMPFVHAEDNALQARGVEVMERLHREAPELPKKSLEAGVQQARKYQDIIRRFGRFPHRNAFLGRESTPEEVEFLKDWAANRAPAAVRGKI
jgi:uncharacterized protein (DUF924 family)